MGPLYYFNLIEDVKGIWEIDDGSLLPAKFLGALLFTSWLLGSLFASGVLFVISLKIRKFFISIRFRPGDFTSKWKRYNSNNWKSDNSSTSNINKKNVNNDNEDKSCN